MSVVAVKALHTTHRKWANGENAPNMTQTLVACAPKIDYSTVINGFV